MVSFGSITIKGSEACALMVILGRNTWLASSYQYGEPSNTQAFETRQIEGTSRSACEWLCPEKYARLIKFLGTRFLQKQDHTIKLAGNLACFDRLECSIFGTCLGSAYKSA